MKSKSTKSKSTKSKSTKSKSTKSKSTKSKSTKSNIDKVKVAIKKEIEHPIKKEIPSEQLISDKERVERYKKLHAIAVKIVDNYNESIKGKMRCK